MSKLTNEKSVNSQYKFIRAHLYLKSRSFFGLIYFIVKAMVIQIRYVT